MIVLQEPGQSSSVVVQKDPDMQVRWQVWIWPWEGRTRCPFTCGTLDFAGGHLLEGKDEVVSAAQNLEYSSQSRTLQVRKSCED